MAFLSNTTIQQWRDENGRKGRVVTLCDTLLKEREHFKTTRKIMIAQQRTIDSQAETIKLLREEINQFIKV